MRIPVSVTVRRKEPARDSSAPCIPVPVIPSYYIIHSRLAREHPRLAAPRTCSQPDEAFRDLEGQSYLHQDTCTAKEKALPKVIELID